MKREGLIGAVLCGSGVVLGAFGSHYLKTHFPPDRLEVWEVGVKYQMYHGLATILCGILLESSRRKENRFGLAANLFVVGTSIFSGSIYLLVGLGKKWLGAITPIGGTCFLIGWAVMALELMKESK